MKNDSWQYQSLLCKLINHVVQEHKENESFFGKAIIFSFRIKVNLPVTGENVSKSLNILYWLTGRFTQVFSAVADPGFGKEELSSATWAAIADHDSCWAQVVECIRQYDVESIWDNIRPYKIYEVNDALTSVLKKALKKKYVNADS